MVYHPWPKWGAHPEVLHAYTRCTKKPAAVAHSAIIARAFTSRPGHQCACGAPWAGDGRPAVLTPSSRHNCWKSNLSGWWLKANTIW